MSQNLIAYWRNYLQGEKEIEITKDGYIFKYTIINQYSNCGAKNWLCCSTKQKLYSFIKYVIIPSIQVSRMFIENTEDICFGTLDYDDTIDVLKNIGITEKVDNNKISEVISTYKKCFKEIEDLEKKDASFNELYEFIISKSNEVDYREGILVDLDLFENISTVGHKLIKLYEKEDMLDQLEDQLELSKSEIESLFDNINDNKFMLKKITTLLNEMFEI